MLVYADSVSRLISFMQFHIVQKYRFQRAAFIEAARK